MIEFRLKAFLLMLKVKIFKDAAVAAEVVAVDGAADVVVEVEVWLG